MSVFRLETFAPISGVGAQRIGPAERRLEAAREAAYQDGFLAGQAMATEAFVEEEGRLTSELVEAIADARLTNEAARRHVAASLAPMVEALAAAIAPALADAGLGAEIARHRRAGADPGARGPAAAPLRAGARRPHRGAAGRAGAGSRRRGGAGTAAARGPDLLGPGLRSSRSRGVHRAGPGLHRLASGNRRKGEDDDPRQYG